MYKTLLFYLLALNVITFLLYGVDKRRAIKDQWRISEKCLLTCALAGGSVGALYGMRVFHHKTKKPVFRILVPLFLVLHIGLALFAMYGVISLSI